MFLLKSLHLTGLLLLGLVLLGYTERPLAKAGTETVWTGKGSTENLKEIMIGRCFNYLGTVNVDAGKKDCPNLWEAFLSAFSGKDPCKITTEDYKPFLDLAGHDIPINQSIFWSQTKGLILQYTGVTHKVMPLESTLVGYMVDGLNWCGKLSSPEPNFEACPGWKECENNSISSFWKAASEAYAMRAHGEVTVMLNGSARGDTFRNNSIFAEIELGKLDNARVTFVHLWIMDNIDGPDKESCDVGSVAVLERILKEKNISYSCKDNYNTAEDQDLSDCQGLGSCQTNQTLDLADTSEDGVPPRPPKTGGPTRPPKVEDPPKPPKTVSSSIPPKTRDQPNLPKSKGVPRPQRPVADPVNRRPGVGPGNRRPGVGPGNRRPGVGPGNRRPGVGPGNRRPGVGPFNQWPGMGPVNRRPGVGPVNQWPGMGPVNQWPGMGPFNQWPGVGPFNQWPGMGPFNQWPGMGPINQWPGMGPINQWPGMGPINRRPGVGPFNQWPGMGPINRRPGVGPINRRPGVGPFNRRPGVGPVNRRPGVGHVNRRLRSIHIDHNWETGAGGLPQPRGKQELAEATEE
ncbi:uncharacterized protein LOC132815982 [Hemiscyllium ocellatum]|uniref:uncharacterized protein LOC132815982 n=1 Tax=Hemiscyllium ocellatum TaxID=170820 RepID=UPI00296692D0|nr:uncharacterized protein LOC132815982 [Hemiscyllium ocellatum]